MSRENANPDKRPAWREPMVWLVAAIPAAAVIGTIALFVVASRSSGTNDAVDARVQRTAQVQVADLGPDASARRLGLAAVVRRAPAFIEVLPVKGSFERDAELVLALNHPARAEQDRSVVLRPTKSGWRGDHDIDFTHDWNLQLRDKSGGWRLQGRWVAGQQATYVQPALEASR
jgi:hypothetical protein